MCGDAKPHLTVPVLKEAFEARDVIVKDHKRGEELDHLAWKAAVPKKAPLRMPKEKIRKAA